MSGEGDDHAPDALLLVLHNVVLIFLSKSLEADLGLRGVLQGPPRAGTEEGAGTLLSGLPGPGAPGERQGPYPNWEFLCLYCHDNEHSRLGMADADGEVTPDREPPRTTFQPFTNLGDLLKKQK